MLGILCGLESEAAVARRVTNAVVACAGARPQKARWLARELVKQGATKLVSFGVAGALEPGLPLGTLVIGTQVASRDGSWTCDSASVAKLTQSLPAAHCGGVWGSEILIGTAMAKRALYERSRCLVVDMESQCAAQIASEAQLPLIVLRAVCDSATMGVPPALLAAIREDGGIDRLRAIWHLLRRPKEIPEMFGVGRGIRKAQKALEGCVDALSSSAS
jgi:hopanoid-associated phosphorylase